MPTPADHRIVMDCGTCRRTEWTHHTGLCRRCRGEMLPPRVADPATDKPVYTGPYPSRPARRER